MASRQNIQTAIGIILLIIILFGLGKSLGLFAVSGVSTLSLTQAQLQSTNSFLSGKVWLLTFSSGGLGQKYTGTFSPSDVQSATSDQTTTTKDFTINVEYSDQTCNYAIANTGTKKPIYDIYSIKWTYVPLVSPCTDSEAKERGMSNQIWNIRPLGILGFADCYAIGYNTQNPVGNLNNPNLESQFDININAGGKIGTKTINTLSGTTQGAVGDFAYAVWQGNLVSGQSCPSQNPYTPVYINGIWRTANNNAYNTYLSQISSTPPTNADALNIWINNLKSSVVSAKQSVNFGAINSQTSLNNAVVKIILQNQIQFPVTTLYIKADTIGIYTPTPEIKLVNADSSCFRTGEQGGIKVDLQNIGTESGVWNVFANCQSPFTATSNLQVSLQPGQTTTKVIPVSASASTEQKASCIIYAESPAGTKQLTANVCVKPQITCSSNQVFCGISGTSEVVKQCSSDGATSSIIKICGVGETCEIDKCVASESISGGGNILEKIGDFFKRTFNFTSKSIQAIRIIASVIIGLFAFLFGFDLFSGFKATSKKGAALTLSLIVAALIGYVAYVSFWIGVILFAVWIIFKLIVGGKLLALKKGVRALRR